MAYNRPVPSLSRLCRRVLSPVFWCLPLGAALVLGSCKEKRADKAVDPTALSAQQALIEKREELLARRRKLQEERSLLQEEMRKVSESGGDTSDLERKLQSTNSLIEQQNDQLADEFQALSAKLDTLASAAAGQRDSATIKDAELRSRERTVTQREDRVNQRELALLDRERQLLQRERETCGPASTVVVQAPPRGGQYTRKEIDPLLARARANMGKRGLLPADLPAHAQGLEREATRALGDNDYGKAYLAASQLVATIDAVKIDRAFVKSKIDRLQRLVGSRRGEISRELNDRLGSGIAAVMKDWGDGDFAQANSKLNQLYSAL